MREEFDFELELFGRSIERRYRKMRPEVEEMPWHTFNADALSESTRIAAQTSWTHAAFQEFRTGAACSIVLTALIEARAPLDLIAVASRFPLDEVVHVELCARMAAALGGASPVRYVPDQLIRRPPDEMSAICRAADIVVRLFCVGEAVSIPLLRKTWHAATHPLPKAILSRIVRDEAAHGTFGFAFMDWALPKLSADEKSTLGPSADRAMRQIYQTWKSLEHFDIEQDLAANPLGWMRSREYATLAHQAMLSHVVEPLRTRGIMVTAHLEAS